MSDLVNGVYPVKSPANLWRGNPASPVRCNFDPIPARLLLTSAALAPITTGQMFVVGIPLQAGDIVNRLYFLTGSTAGATLTHMYAALYDTAGNLLAQSTDQQNVVLTADVVTAQTAQTALAANTLFGFNLGSNATPTPVGIASPGIYYAALSVTGTTMPTFAGFTLGNLAYSGPVLGTVAASLFGVEPGAFLARAGLAAGAGNMSRDAVMSQVAASTYTGTAPAAVTTNGAPTGLAPVPVAWAA